MVIKNKEGFWFFTKLINPFFLWKVFKKKKIFITLYLACWSIFSSMPRCFALIWKCLISQGKIGLCKTNIIKKIQLIFTNRIKVRFILASNINPDSITKFYNQINRKCQKKKRKNHLSIIIKSHHLYTPDTPFNGYKFSLLFLVHWVIPMNCHHGIWKAVNIRLRLRNHNNHYRRKKSRRKKSQRILWHWKKLKKKKKTVDSSLNYTSDNFLVSHF